MAALVATLPMQLVCQLIVTGLPSVTENGIPGPPAAGNAPPAQTRIAELPEGYVAYANVGAAYKIYNESVLWKVARRRCISDGGNLAVIDSHEKFDCLSSQRKSKGVTHVGIHSLFDDDEWVNVKNGLPVSNIPWASGEPNGRYHCAMVKHERGGLGNFDCTTALGDFVCEISMAENYEAEARPRIENTLEIY